MFCGFGRVASSYVSWMSLGFGVFSFTVNSLGCCVYDGFGVGLSGSGFGWVWVVLVAMVFWA